MGWWPRGDAVIGDPVADFLEAIKEACGGRLPWTSPADIGPRVRESIVQFYIDELGREPTEEDLRELIEFVNLD